MTDTPVLKRRPAAALLWLLLLAGTALTQPVLAASPRVASPEPADPVTLKPLPAGRDDLVFHGESTSRRWSVYLSRTEADRASVMQIGLLNAVVVLPERSSLKLTINGHILSVLPVHSPDKVSILRVKIPAGVLMPGNNRVEVGIVLTHRVDCSVKATYELWAMLDPAQTGIVTEARALSSIHSLEDIAAEPLAADGTMRIHVRMADGADTYTIERAARLVEALVRRANLVRPVVDVGPNMGQGAGFDVVLSTGLRHDEGSKPLRVLGQDGNVTLGRDATTNRLVLIMAGQDGADLDQQIAALDKAGPQARASVPSGGAIALDAQTRTTFADLGLAVDAFTGRHYLASVNVNLPSNFYPANYDKARLLIDGSQSASLAPGSELIFRVNGSIVSTKQLAAGSAERFQHDLVELPLRFFHAGHNELAIEGITTSPADQACDVVSMPHDTRLSISGSSVLEFPQFAHLGTLPQIPAALSTDGAAAGRLQIYLPDATTTSIGPALTILANMASTSGVPADPHIHLGTPMGGDVPGVVIGPIDQLPSTLTATLHRLAAPAAPAVLAIDHEKSPDRIASGEDSLSQAAAANATRFRADWTGLMAGGADLLRQRGFFFTSADPDSSPLSLTARSVLIGAVAPDRARAKVGGLELPQFTRDPAQWLVVTAKSSEVYEAGIERLVANGQWSELSGQAVSLDLDTNQLRSAQPARVTYVMPNTLVLSDIRPILGGIVSNNIVLSLAVLMLLMASLGISTHVLIRRSGAK